MNRNRHPLLGKIHVDRRRHDAVVPGVAPVAPVVRRAPAHITDHAAEEMYPPPAINLIPAAVTALFHRRSSVGVAAVASAARRQQRGRPMPKLTAAASARSSSGLGTTYPMPAPGGVHRRRQRYRICRLRHFTKLCVLDFEPCSVVGPYEYTYSKIYPYGY